MVKCHSLCEINKKIIKDYHEVGIFDCIVPKLIDDAPQPHLHNGRRPASAIHRHQISWQVKSFPTNHLVNCKFSGDCESMLETLTP